MTFPTCLLQEPKRLEVVARCDRARGLGAGHAAYRRGTSSPVTAAAREAMAVGVVRLRPTRDSGRDLALVHSPFPNDRSSR